MNIYSDSNCNQLIGKASATSTSATVRVSGDLADGNTASMLFLTTLKTPPNAPLPV